VFLAGGDQLLQLQQDLIPRSSHLLSSYYLLKHISQSLATAVPLDIMYAHTHPRYTDTTVSVYEGQIVVFGFLRETKMLLDFSSPEMPTCSTFQS
jgi:hypothetical protein